MVENSVPDGTLTTGIVGILLLNFHSDFHIVLCLKYFQDIFFVLVIRNVAGNIPFLWNRIADILIVKSAHLENIQDGR